AGARYQGSVRAAVLTYKEHGHLALATPLGRLLAAALTAGLGTAQGGPAPALAGALLVPVPSTRSATRTRGQDHALRLARRAAAMTGLSTAAALRWTRPVQDQSALSVLNRRLNVAGAMAARPPSVAGSPALLVDDVMTTGATLDEAHRALAVAGYRVVRVCVIAAVETQRASRPAPPPPIA
ncbi:MAG: phosphoribosyltransferase family protein, partial [Actinomycetes bacterium]